ncbi:MAG: deoxyribose-phosphate aldolase [Ilumatobacteraceae bacterium]|nr:deoxyribose-phosphate aldolase [Ilumatobacteraceae bacterium]
MTQNDARRAISLVDLTNLNDDCEEAAVIALCERARRYGTAAVCVWPDFVAAAATQLAGTDVGIATVVNFPTGDERVFSVVGQTERALDDGATEIDLVLPYRAFAAGDHAHAAAMVRAVRSASAGRARLKVILETGELVDTDVVRAAAELAVGEGADFIKTSTGKSAVSATTEAVTTMMQVIAEAGRPVGIKPSGGISSADDAERYIGLAEAVMGDGWVGPATFRFGASSLLGALIEAAGLDGDTPPPPTGY